MLQYCDNTVVPQLSVCGFRLVAVHYEAIRAHLNSKKYVSAIRVFLKAPAVIVVETLRLANRVS